MTTYTVARAAELAGTTPNTIAALIAAGKLEQAGIRPLWWPDGHCTWQDIPDDAADITVDGQITELGLGALLLRAAVG